MEEPTHRQHLILKEIDSKCDGYRTGKEDDIELYWELVRAGYLKNLVVMGGPYEWRFILEDKAKEYLETIYIELEKIRLNDLK